MNLTPIKLERVLILIILGFLLFNLLNKKQINTTNQPKTTIVRDTIWQTKVDTFKIQTIKYQKVYVRKNNLTKVVKDTISLKGTTNYIAAKIYRDTLNNDNLEIYSYNLIKGKLLDSKISYKLKTPKEITITKTIEHPKTYKSGLYLFSEIGGNTQKFDNISFGLQYNRKGNWFASYRLNLSELKRPTHNVGIGFRLFN